MNSDCDGIGQSDQSLQAGWESLERKAVVWCLISRSPRADGRRVKECLCVYVRERARERKMKK